MKRLVIGVCCLVCLLPVFNAAALAADPLSGEARLALNAVQVLTDETLGGIHSALTVLAATGEVQSLDWDTMQPLLAVLQNNAPACAVWFAEPDGTYYTVDDGLMDLSLADRDYFGPLSGGADIFGTVVVSKSTGRLSAVVAVPLYRDGDVVGALGASVFTEDLAWNLAANLQLPAEYSLVALDATGEFAYAVSATDTDWYAACTMVSFTDAADVVELEVDGAPVTALHQTSWYNGWHYLLVAH